MTTSSRRLAVATVLTIVLSATVAHAQQPTAADLESARELYKEGKDLRQKGDLRGALEKFKQAHAYGQTPVTALELGKTHMQLGELVEAREVLLSVARMKVQSDETDKSAAARTEAETVAEQIRPKIPTLTIKITGIPPDAPVELRIDGAPVPVVSLAATRKTNPGTHVVTAKSGAREAKSSVDVAEGDSKEVPLSLLNETAPPPITPPPGGETPPPAASRSIHVVTWIGLGVGAVGIGLGTVTGVIAIGKGNTVKQECNGTSCPPATKKTVDSGRTMATISTISFIGAGAGVALAAVGYFVLSTPSSSAGGPRVRLAAGPTTHGASLGLDGTF